MKPNAKQQRPEKGFWFGLVILLTLVLTACRNQTGGNFNIALEPNTLTLQPGQNGSVALILESQNFSGKIDLRHSVPSGITLRLQYNPWNIPGSGVHRQEVTVNTVGSVTPRNYTITLIAVSGSITKTTNLSLTVQVPPPAPDFTLSLNPDTLTVPQGQSGTTTLTLTPQNGFTGQVSLALERQDGSPAPQGLTLSPQSVNATGRNPVTQALTISVAQGVAPGIYALRMKARAGELLKAENLQLIVTAVGSQPGQDVFIPVAAVLYGNIAGERPGECYPYG